jgi:hypothetical protein
MTPGPSADFVKLVSEVMTDVVLDTTVDPGAAEGKELWIKFYGQESIKIRDDHPGLDDNTMEMQLRRAFLSVLACREAMWDELQIRPQKRPGELRRLGWELDDKESKDFLRGEASMRALSGRCPPARVFADNVPGSDMCVRVSLRRRLAEAGCIEPSSLIISKERAMRARLACALAKRPLQDESEGVCRRLCQCYGRKEK